MEFDMANIIVDDMDFSDYVHETEAKTKIHKASDYVEALKLRLRQRKSRNIIVMPWEKTQDNFELRKGEVTLWSGQNGHGKSLLTNQVALSLISQGEKVVIASFEMKPATTLQRMSRMWIGVNPISEAFQGEEGLKQIDTLYDEFGEWSDNRLWLYNQMGTTDMNVVIGMARYCAKELGINHIFIDNLAKCISHDDDYNGQKMFMDEITAVARDYQVHIHVVHHLRKPANENIVPDKHDNKGSGTITDQVDNVMMIWRNKPKEEDIKVRGEFSGMSEEPDQYLLCRKQRNYEGSDEGEPTIGLWFHRDAQQYLGDIADQPMDFVRFPHG